MRLVVKEEIMLHRRGKSKTGVDQIVKTEAEIRIWDLNLVNLDGFEVRLEILNLIVGTDEEQ